MTTAVANHYAATTKWRAGTAALAIAAAAAFTPAVAHASPVAPLPTAGLGSSAVADCTLAPTPVCPPTSVPFANGTPSSSPHTILQNQFWWFGAPNANPPEQTLVYTFYPLTLVPGIIRPAFGWFENINYEGCILGATLRIGPYGTVSGSYSRGCA